jgi:hypothetical protein
LTVVSTCRSDWKPEQHQGIGVPSGIRFNSSRPACPELRGVRQRCNDPEFKEPIVPRNSLMSRAEHAIESSPWVLPGILVGAFALTRVPFGLLAGAALGFAAGWALRREQDARGASQPRGKDRDAAPYSSNRKMEEEEKVDAMVDDSFPASDPPSFTPTRAGKPKPG